MIGLYHHAQNIQYCCVCKEKINFSDDWCAYDGPIDNKPYYSAWLDGGSTPFYLPARHKVYFCKLHLSYIEKYN